MAQPLMNWDEFKESMRHGTCEYELPNIYVHDNLECAKAIGEHIFGNKVSEDTIFQIYDRLVAAHHREMDTDA